MLQTQLRHGQISFDDKDLVVYKENLRVPQDKIRSLEQYYGEVGTWCIASYSGLTLVYIQPYIVLNSPT